MWHTAATRRSTGIILSLSALTAFCIRPAYSQAKKPPTKTANTVTTASAITVDGVSFVKWTEPKEGAFSLEVPQGWRVDAGIVRVAPTDTRTGIQVRSPEDTMTVMLADPALPLFSYPTLADQQLGHGEGYSEIFGGDFQRMILHYMPASEFNRWYIQNRLGVLVDDLMIVGDKPLPELSQKLTAMANQNGSTEGNHVAISVGSTWFKGRIKATGKFIHGAVLSTTRLLYSDSPNYIRTWHADPVVLGCEDGENKEALSRKTLGVFLHMKQTLVENPVWVLKENQRVAAISAAKMKKQLAQQPGGGRQSGTVHSGGAVSQKSLMAAYWKRNAQRAESTHQFVNYLRDEKDVIDPTTGERHTIPE